MQQQRILVTGAAGFVGRAVSSELARRGYVVRRAQRTATGHDSVGVGEIGPATDWTDAVSSIDCVVHCAARAHVLADRASDPLEAFRAVNTGGTISLARHSVEAGVKRLIFISSIGVNGNETTGTPMRADDPPRPHSPYAVSKLEAEHALHVIARETGLEVVVIRPPLILGRDAKGNLGAIRTLIARGVPLPFGALRGNRRDLVSLPVLVDLIARCVEQPQAAGQTLLVSDGVARSTRAIAEEIARLERRPARFLPIPAPLLDLALRLAGRSAMRSQLLGDLELDIGPTQRALGWTVPSAAGACE